MYIYIFPIKTNTKQQKFCHRPPTPTSWNALSASFLARDLDKLGALGHVYRPKTPDVFVSLKGRKIQENQILGYPNFHRYTCATHRSWFAIPELMQFLCVAPPTMDRLDINGEVCWGCIEVNDRRSSACAWFVNGRFTPNGKNYTTG